VDARPPPVASVVRWLVAHPACVEDGRGDRHRLLEHTPCEHIRPERVSESGPGGLAHEVDTPLPSKSPHDQMILRVDLVDSHGRWKRPCLQTAHMTI
jgi:hypothetical protein